MAAQDTIDELAMHFPEAPKEELARFCKARPGSAIEAKEMYEAYQKWRQGPGNPQSLRAAAEAIPQKYIRHSGTALDGTPLFLLQGARYDVEVEPEQYVLAVAAAMDMVVPATDGRKVTVLLDVRPAEGWPNVPATRMLPLFRLAAGALSDLFPERLQRLVIYPMPWIVTGLWTCVKQFFDPVTREKVVILSGEAAIGSECPAAVGEYVSLDQLPADAHDMHASLATLDDCKAAP